MQEKRFTPTKQDMRALARVAENEDEPVHFRTEAEFVVGLARWDARDRDGAGRHYRRCIALGSVASPAERAVREWASGHDERGAPAIVKKAAGDLMDYTVQLARDNLRVLESPVGARPAEYAAKGPWLRADGSEIPNELRITGVPLSGGVELGCRATQLEHLRSGRRPPPHATHLRACRRRQRWQECTRYRKPTHRRRPRGPRPRASWRLCRGPGPRT